MASVAPGTLVGYSWSGDQAQHVLYQDSFDGHIWELRWSGAWQISDLTVASGAPNPGQPEAAYIWDVNKSQHVVFWAYDNHIHEMWWNGAWHYMDLTVAAGAPLANEAPVIGYQWVQGGDQAQHVMYTSDTVGPKGFPETHVHELRLQSQANWVDTDITVAAQAPPVHSGSSTSLFGYTFQWDATQHVLYVGEDNHIHELWYFNQWHHNDLTIAAGIPASVVLVSRPQLYAYIWESDSTQHVIFTATNGHIHELLWNGIWNYTDLTVAAGAPLAAGSPCGLEWGGDQHVFYTGLVPGQGGNTRIYELKFASNPPGERRWVVNDLSAAANAPSSPPRYPRGELVAYSHSIQEPPQQTIHVLYVDTLSRIIELWQAAGLGWQMTDLFATVGA